MTEDISCSVRLKLFLTCRNVPQVLRFAFVDVAQSWGPAAYSNTLVNTAVLNIVAHSFKTAVRLLLEVVQ